MTALVLSLALSAPAHPPAQPQFPLPLPATPQFPLPPQFPAQPVPPAQPQVLTLEQFSRYFTPTPGKHRVWVVHPRTRRPVEVCFALPGGKMNDYEVDRDSIRFEFSGGEEVEIEFRSNGTVRVEYDD